MDQNEHQAVPSQSAQREQRENKQLARILFNMVEGGGERRDKDIYTADYKPGDGDAFVHRAAEVLVEQDAEIEMLLATINLLTEEAAKARASLSQYTQALPGSAAPGCPTCAGNSVQHEDCTDLAAAPAPAHTMTAEPVAEVRAYASTGLGVKWLGNGPRPDIGTKLYAGPLPGQIAQPGARVRAYRAGDVSPGELVYKTADVHAARGGAAAAAPSPSDQAHRPAPAPTVQTPPAQRMYIDQIDAGMAGEKWLSQYIARAACMVRSEEPPGGQSPRVKWVVLFDHDDRLTQGYMLTRDIMNWTQLTIIDNHTQAGVSGIATCAPDV